MNTLPSVRHKPEALIRTTPLQLGRNQRVMVIEPDARIDALLVGADPTVSIVHSLFSMLSRATLASVHPDSIIAPLITPDWDVLDIGMALNAFGFTGTLVAVSGPLPRAELIRSEVAALCPHLTLVLAEI